MTIDINKSYFQNFHSGNFELSTKCYLNVTKKSLLVGIDIITLIILNKVYRPQPKCIFQGVLKHMYK